MTENKALKKINIHLICQIIVFLLLICFDQASKNIASGQLKDSADAVFLKNILSFHYVENTGAAFGILNKHPWVFILISSIISIAVIIIYSRIILSLRKYASPENTNYKSQTFNSRIFLCYILTVLMAGAIGNLIDRIFNGYVIDFIKSGFINFPVFNLADIYVTVSTVFLVIFFIFIYKE